MDGILSQSLPSVIDFYPFPGIPLRSAQARILLRLRRSPVPNPPYLRAIQTITPDMTPIETLKASLLSRRIVESGHLDFRSE